ncbi:hypothetical protein [Natronomonas sp.]|uniref:hypothetical protein n=1 Tax=Natronomonas sp. TaxID=2184060 RepID=UPI002609566F|nr:hypothetical protein [Natronomonas sp.]
MADDQPTFAIPKRPTRRYPRRGGVEYEGQTVFSLTPAGEYDDDALRALVEAVLRRPPYRYGDWFDLPMPLYLVHDDRTGDTFRAAVRDGAVELYVLPETERDGLRAFYERLCESSETSWNVACRTD